MASLGMDPAAAAERLDHADGGALFPSHLSASVRERKTPACWSFGARVQALLDKEWTEDAEASDSGLNEAEEDDGRTWDRTRPKGKRLGATRGDRAGALQGDSGSSGGGSERSETTRSDSALGQETDDDPDLDDDPRSQRGPSRTAATQPDVAGDEPADWA